MANVPKQLDKLIEHALGGGALLGDEAVIVAAEVGRLTELCEAQRVANDVLCARVAGLEGERAMLAGWRDRFDGDLRELLDAFDGPGGTQEHALHVIDKARRTLRVWDALAGQPPATDEVGTDG